MSSGSDSPDYGYSIQGQRFTSDGSTQGSQFLVNSYTPDIQFTPSVAMDPQGGFVVVYESLAYPSGDTSSYGIQVRRFSSSGTALGPKFLVKTHTTGYQARPALAVDSEGDFVVVWTSDGSNNARGQRFEPDGSPTGEEFQVNSRTLGSQSSPSMAGGLDRRFAIVWTSWGADQGDTSHGSIRGQRFRSPVLLADGFESGDTARWSTSSP